MKKALYNPCLYHQLYNMTDLERSRSPHRIPRHIPSTQFCIIHHDLFAGTGIPARALLEVLAKLWDQNIKIAYIKGYHYEKDSQAHRMYRVINQDNPLQSTLRDDICMISKDTMYTVDQNTKALFTIGSPCTKISRGTLVSKPSSEFVGPHVFPSNLVWAAQSAIINFEHINTSHNAVISIAEMVPPAAKIWKDDLTAAFGNPNRLETHILEGAARDRDFYTSPYISLPTYPFSHRQGKLFPNGEEWDPVDKNQLQPPTVRSIYPKLLQDVAQGSASNTDIRTVGQFRIKSTDGSHRYAKPEHLAWWMGIPLNVINRISKEFPCEQDPIHHYLIQPRRNLHEKFASGFDSAFSLCGHKVLCAQCTIAADLIGRAWNFDVAKAVLHAALYQAFVAKDPVFHNFKSIPPHYCHPDCPFKVTIGQLPR